MSEFYDSLEENDDGKSLSAKKLEADSTLVPYYTGSKSLQSIQLDDLKILSKLSKSKSNQKNENSVSSSTTSTSAYSFDLDDNSKQSRPSLMPRVKNYKSNLFLRTKRKSYLEQFRTKVGLTKSEGSSMSETARSIFGDGECDVEGVHDLVNEVEENVDEGSDTESLFYQKLIASNTLGNMTKINVNSETKNFKKIDSKKKSESVIILDNVNQTSKEQKKMYGKKEFRCLKKSELMSAPKRLGGLGPDLESVKPKMELRKRQLEYGIAASSRNQLIISRMKASEKTTKFRSNKNNAQPPGVCGGGESTQNAKSGDTESILKANPTTLKAEKDYAIRGRRVVKSSGDATSSMEDKESIQILNTSKTCKYSSTSSLVKNSEQKVTVNKQKSGSSIEETKIKNFKVINSKVQRFKSSSMDDEMLKTLSERHKNDVVLAQNISKSLCCQPVTESKACLVALDSFVIESS